METLLDEALSRLNHPNPSSVIEAAAAARIGYSGAVSEGAKRTRATDPNGSMRVNEALLPLAFSVSEDGVASPVGGLAVHAVLSILQGDFSNHTRPAGLSAEERNPGYNCIVSPWKGDGTPGRFLATLYSTRKSYALISDHDPIELAVLADLILLCECLLGDPVVEKKKSATAVAALFAKRR